MYCRCEHDGHDMDAGVCSTDVFRRREWYRTVSCEGGHGVCKDRNDAGGIKEKMLVDQRLKYTKSAWGSTVVIQMFRIGSSEAGSSVCLVNTHYCCSCLTNRSSFASHMNLVYGHQHSQAIVRPLCKTMARQGSPPWRDTINNDEDLE